MTLPSIKIAEINAAKTICFRMEEALIKQQPPTYIISHFDAVNDELKATQYPRNLRDMINQGSIYSAIGNDGIERVIKNQVMLFIYLERYTLDTKSTDEPDSEHAAIKQDLCARKKAGFVKTAMVFLADLNSEKELTNAKLAKLETEAGIIEKYIIKYPASTPPASLTKLQTKTLEKNSGQIMSAINLYNVSIEHNIDIPQPTDPRRLLAPAISGRPVTPDYSYLLKHCDRDSTKSEIKKMRPTVADYVEYLAQATHRKDDDKRLELNCPKYG